MFTKNPVYINSIKNYIVLGQEEGSTGQEARNWNYILLTILKDQKLNFH